MNRKKLKVSTPIFSEIRGLVVTVFGTVLLLTGCSEDPVIPDARNSDTYLFLGHTYQHNSPHENNRVDHRLESVDYSAFRAVLLGGDVCSETTKFERTVDYVDDFFDLGSERTLWTMGNHDVRNGNLNWVTERTGRELFYTSRFDDIQWVVLYTPFDREGEFDCAMRAEQWNMLTTVLDTVTTAESVVVLMHYMMWGNVEPGISSVKQLANVDKSALSFTCDSVKTFETDLYRVLGALPDRGIQAIVISGDGGQKCKQFHYTSGTGVEFFLSGINNSLDTSVYQVSYEPNFNPDSILQFKKDPVSGTLVHEFVRLSEFVE